MKSATKTVLVMRSGYAHWSRWHRNKLQDEFIEPMQPTASGKFVSACPWLGSDYIGVHGIIDTPLEEVELFMPQGHAGWIMQGLNRRAILAQLRNHNPHAQVRWCQLHKHQELALVASSRLPEDWHNWLESMQKKGVTLLSAQPLSDVYFQQLMAARSDLLNKRLLLVLGEGREQRHIFCVRNCVCFSRITNARSINDNVAAVADSIEHLLARKMLLNPVCVLTHGVDVECAESLRSLTDVASVTVLAQTSIVSVVGQFVAQQRKPFRSSASVYLRKYRQRCRALQLRWATWITGLMALCALIVMCLLAIHSVRVENAQEDYRRAVQSTRKNLQQQALLLHPDPLAASESLQRAEQLRRVMAVSPLTLLGTLAAAFTESPNVNLELLAWRSTDYEIDSEVQLPLVEISAATAGLSRQSMPMADTSASHLQVLLEGAVSVSSPRIQQSLFQLFVERLRSAPEVVAVNVASSPLDALLEPTMLDRSESSGRSSAMRGHFQLRLLVAENAR